ncbi:MAG: DUF502 domain-containing protein [Bacteroidetes bacterium]|nr:DUF502 domain-containing protein [Bacteroidota bacterium]
MKANGLLTFIRTTILGGIFFLLPLIVIVFIFSKALAIVRKITIPLANAMPVDMIWNVPIDRVLAWMVVLGICFLAGMIAKVRRFNRLGRWLDQNILSEVPGYSFMKEMGVNIAGLKSDYTRTPVMVEVGPVWQLGFLIEKINEELSAVFLPGAPSPTSGKVIFVEQHKLKLLDISQKDVMKIMSKMGIGAGDRLRDSL